MIQDLGVTLKTWISLVLPYALGDEEAEPKAKAARKRGSAAAKRAEAAEAAAQLEDAPEDAPEEEDRGEEAQQEEEGEGAGEAPLKRKRTASKKQQEVEDNEEASGLALGA